MRSVPPESKASVPRDAPPKLSEKPKTSLLRWPSAVVLVLLRFLAVVVNLDHSTGDQSANTRTGG